ncbi:MAG: hypothetical protein HY319_12055 [Armatimonadetes bacterium]|nr:hypothetical protein [Armatimonadota bacterium]
MRWILVLLLAVSVAGSLGAETDVPSSMSLQKKLGKVSDCKQGYLRIYLLANKDGEPRVGLFLKGRDKEFTGYLDERRWEQLSQLLRQAEKDLAGVQAADHRTLGEVKALTVESFQGSFYVELMGQQKAGVSAVVLRGRDVDNTSAWLFFDQQQIQELFSAIGAVDSFMNEG